MPAVWAYSVLCRFLGNLEDEAPLLPYLAGLPLHQKFNELLSCLYLPGSGMNVGCPLPTPLSKRPSHHHPSAHHSCPFTDQREKQYHSDNEVRTFDCASSCR